MVGGGPHCIDDLQLINIRVGSVVVVVESSNRWGANLFYWQCLAELCWLHVFARSSAPWRFKHLKRFNSLLIEFLLIKFYVSLISYLLALGLFFLSFFSLFLFLGCGFFKIFTGFRMKLNFMRVKCWQLIANYLYLINFIHLLVP